MWLLPLFGMCVWHVFIKLLTYLLTYFKSLIYLERTYTPYSQIESYWMTTGLTHVILDDVAWWRQARPQQHGGLVIGISIDDKTLQLTPTYISSVQYEKLCSPVLLAKATTNMLLSVRAKLHYTGAGYEHRLRTPPTNTTNGQKFATSQHLDMSRCGKFVVELLWACPLVVSVAGVRSRCPCSEFGSYRC